MAAAAAAAAVTGSRCLPTLRPLSLVVCGDRRPVRFAWAIPDERALRVLKHFGPIVEVSLPSRTCRAAFLYAPMRACPPPPLRETPCMGLLRACGSFPPVR